MGATRDKAAAFDAQDLPAEAAEAYEQAIAEGDADLDTYIDLAVLYNECNDEGYYAYHHLPDEFIEKTYGRAMELLDEAEAKFGKHAEIDFWRQFFPWDSLGEPSFIPLAEEIAATGESLVPYFYLYVFSESGERRQYRKKAEALYDLVKDKSTVKKRRIISTLEAPLVDGLQR